MPGIWSLKHRAPNALVDVPEGYRKLYGNARKHVVSVDAMFSA